jgi:hypothetical protein
VKTRLTAALICLILMVPLTLTILGCTNTQYYPVEPGLEFVMNQDDFSKLIIFANIRSRSNTTENWIFLDYPVIEKAIPQSDLNGMKFSYLALYVTKDSKKALVLLGDNSPQKLLFKIIF